MPAMSFFSLARLLLVLSFPFYFNVSRSLAHSLARTHTSLVLFYVFIFIFVFCSFCFGLWVRFTLDTRLQDIGSDAGLGIIVDVPFPRRSCSSFLFPHILSVISLFFFSFSKAR